MNFLVFCSRGELTARPVADSILMSGTIVRYHKTTNAMHINFTTKFTFLVRGVTLRSAFAEERVLDETLPNGSRIL